MKVRYRGGETFQTQQGDVPLGIYELHNADDVFMCGFVEIKGVDGHIWVVDYKLLEIVE